MVDKERIGFVGAGLMGRGMALNLIRAGFPVMIHVHRNREGIDELIAMGAKATGSLQVLAENCDVVVMCLSNADTVRAVIDGLSPGLRRNHLVIDATTSSPDATVEIAELLDARGIRYADAPVTGGPRESEAGKLGSLVGCREEDFERVRNIVSNYSKVVQRIGGVGTGHRAKLLNNFVTQGTGALLAEAYCRARDSGVDWHALYAVMEAGAARSGTLEKMVKPALDGNYDGSRFSLRNALKDYNYFCETAEKSARGPSKLGQQVREILKEAVDAGFGDRYVSALLDPELDRRKKRDDQA